MSATPPDALSLREYIDLRLTELEKRLDQRTALLLSANDRDKVVMNERLAGMNEFRASLRDQASQFVQRSEVDLRLKPLEAFMNNVTGRLTMLAGGLAMFFVVVQIVLRILWTK